MDYILETYEWDNTWIEKTNDNTAKRVLYIGDSISVGARAQANVLSCGKILFDGFGTSKSLDNPYYFSSLSLFMKQVPNRHAIIFNNGLHGWHLSEDEYEKFYNEFLDRLIAENPRTPILPILTTFSVNESYFNHRVIKRNEIVKKLSDQKGLEIIDLYSISHDKKDLLLQDGVHYSNEGSSAFASEILRVIGEII